MARIEPKTYRSNVAIPPGETVAEMIGEVEIPVFELAERVGLTEDEVISLLRGELELTSELAENLSHVFKLPPHFWLNLEKDYRETLERIGDRVEVEENIGLARRFPISNMIALSWIEKGETVTETAANLLDFLGITSWRYFNTTRVFSSAFRKSPSKDADSYALAAWLRKGEIEAGSSVAGPIDLGALMARLGDLRALTLLPPGEFIPRLLATCAKHGVLVVFVPEIPKCFASGAAYRLGDHFVIQLSLRYKTNDHFWFSFFHELGHVLLHNDRGTFIDGYTTDEDAQEREANEFASSTLIPKAEYRAFALGRRPSKDAVIAFASSIGIDPGIVVGRLQRDKIIPPDRFNDLKTRFEWVKNQSTN